MSQGSLAAGRLTETTLTQARYVATGTLVALALLLLARHLAGALVAPLSPNAALACSFAMGALVLIAELHPRSGRGRDTHLPRIAAALAAILLPTASLPALLAKFAWVPMIVAAPLLRRDLRNEASFAGPATKAPLASRVRQQLTRSLEADGADVCRGSARAEFAVGQRIASIHLAFCPPFETTPQLEAAAADALDVKVKVMQVLPYAARIDVKLSAPAAAINDVLVSFTARSSS